ncbi:hypothetical protein GALL_531490 [mine drainage metagenome]|uniref:Uncharacterized protein n=1 Tax=mine drainage metagenome TaxID=410659 RepID=A0A1J5P2E9_9ZZZZ
MVHGPHLGRSRDGAARKERGKHVGQTQAGQRRGAHRRRHLPHGGQGMQLEQRGHLDAAGLRDARQIVAQQVNDHHVFSALLGGPGHGAGQFSVLQRAAAARCRAFHRAGQDMAVFPVKKQLWRDRQDLLETAVDTGRVAARLGALQALEQGGCTAGERAVQRCGVVDLVKLPGGNGLVDQRHLRIKLRSVQVAVPFDVGIARGLGWLRRLRANSAVACSGLSRPRQGVLEHAKPGQWPVGGMGFQRRIKSTGGLIAQVADAPQALSGQSLHRIQHRLDLLCRMCHQHLARAAKSATQAPVAGGRRTARTLLLRVAEVNPYLWLHRPRVLQWPAPVEASTLAGQSRVSTNS